MPAASVIRCVCPSCEAPLVLKNPALAGKEIACPKCKERFVVPSADEDQDDDERPRKKKKKKKAPQSHMGLYLALGGGGLVLVALAVVLVVILTRNRNAPIVNPDKDAPQAKNDGGNPPGDKPVPPPRKDGATPPAEKYVIPANLPLWEPRPLVDKRVTFEGATWSPRAQWSFRKFQVLLPPGWAAHPDFPDYVHVPEPGQPTQMMWQIEFMTGGGKDLGFGPGRKSPKGLLEDHINFMNTKLRKFRTYEFEKIEEGKNNSLALARAKFTWADSFGNSGRHGVLYVAMDPPDALFMECRCHDRNIAASFAIMETVALSTKR
jgi:hypothetical protein